MDIIPNHQGPIENAQVNGQIIDHDGADMNQIDQISNLPNDVLCHILSFLDTKYAAGTSILSTRFRNLLPLVPNLKLRFYDTCLLHPDSPAETNLTSFQNFIDQLLNVTLRDVPSIQSFHLFCQKFDDGHVIADWITAALRLNVKTMDIRINELKNSTFVLDSLFGCNLVSLDICLDFADDITEVNFSFPKLRELIVHAMTFNHASVLLPCCPVLENLVLNNLYCDLGDTLKISVPSLKTLTLINDFDLFIGEVEIDAPGLVHLIHSGHLAIRYSVEKLKSLKSAHLYLKENGSQLPWDCDEEADALIRACSGAEKLWMLGTFVIMLYYYPHPLPRLQNLVDLEVVNMDYRGWELLPSLIDAAPKLKNVYLRGRFNTKRYASFKISLKESISIGLSRLGVKFFRLAIGRKEGSRVRLTCLPS